MNFLRPLLRRMPAAPQPAIPAGKRVYAIGDIHGRLDLFEALAGAIEADDAARGAADTTVILLGDLVDRGPDSAGVIAGARIWSTFRKVRILCGNHEDMMLQALQKRDAMRAFLRFGGRETILSYPVDATRFHAAELDEAMEIAREAIPAEDVAFIASFEQGIAIGDYFFVHAGVQPGVPLVEQDPHELRWIREPFLSHAGDHGAMIVHGHTITDEPELRRNRIGIDTGAYNSGRLTAIGLEGTERWLIEASACDGSVGCAIRTC